MKFWIEQEEKGTEMNLRKTVEEQGQEVVQGPKEADIIVALGGDGAILRAARSCEEPTILPVRGEGSKGYKMEIDEEELSQAIRAVEEGDYRLEEKSRVAAYKDGREIYDDFKALNEVQLHHKFPGSAVRFRAELRDGTKELRPGKEEFIGDGIIVSTPFGSTGYHKTVSGEVIQEGIGVAFNNIHSPEDYRGFLHLTKKGTVLVEVLEEGSGILARDNDPKLYEPKLGEKIEIKDADSPVEIVKVNLRSGKDRGET